MSKKAYLLAALLVFGVILVGFFLFGGQSNQYKEEPSSIQLNPPTETGIVNIGVNEDTTSATFEDKE